MNKKCKKGVTLLELTIVMALLAIVSAMVISFSTLVRNNVLTITTENVVLSDFNKIKKTYENWITTFDDEDYEFYLENNNVLVAINKNSPSKTYKLLMNEEGILVGSIPTDDGTSSKSIYYCTGTIDSLNFVIHENEDTHKLLIELAATYTRCNTAGTKEETKDVHFLKATRVATLYNVNGE